MMKMHTNLMGASAIQPAFDQARLIPRANDAVLSFGRSSPRRSHTHSLSMHGVPANFFFDHARLFAQFSGDERKINLFDPPLCKLPRQFSMRLIVLRDNKTAACFFVETVNDPGSFFAADSREGRAMAEQCVDQGVLPMTRARMNDEPRRFIDDNDIFVFEQNLKWNRLRLIVDLFQRRLG